MRARRAVTTTAVLLLAFLSVLGTGTYTVRRGDTLGRIASANGTTALALAKLNGLADPDYIQVGQTLRLTGDGGGASGTPAQAPAGGATTHVVKAGETVAGIAARYGIPRQQLVDANGIVQGRIYTGQRLLLVARAGEGPSTATTYKVKAGDSLSSIARRHGVSLRALQSANGITDPDVVRIGRVLKLPGRGEGGVLTVCPVAATVQFMNDWGFPRSGDRFHEGNDLFASRGRPVVAVVSGRAVRSAGRLGGNVVSLYGDDGNRYYYAHLDRYGASGRVEQGQVIGYVGSTGNAAGGPTHLHFEIHPGGGAAVNPYPSLGAVCTR